MKKIRKLIAVVAVLSAVASQLPADAGLRNVGEDWKLTVIDNLYQSGFIDWTGVGGAFASGYVEVGAELFNVKEFAPIAVNGASSALVKDWGGVWAYCIDNAWSQSPDWYVRHQDGSVPTPNIPTITKSAWAQKVWLTQKYGYSSLVDRTHSAAMQLAVWETVTDGGAGTIGFATGNFMANSFSTAVMAQANTYLGYIVAQSAVSGWDWNTFDTSTDVYFVSGDIPASTSGQNYNAIVPELPTALLAPIGLGLIGLIKRKIG